MPTRKSSGRKAELAAQEVLVFDVFEGAEIDARGDDLDLVRSDAALDQDVADAFGDGDDEVDVLGESALGEEPARSGKSTRRETIRRGTLARAQAAPPMETARASWKWARTQPFLRMARDSL